MKYKKVNKYRKIRLLINEGITLVTASLTTIIERVIVIQDVSICL